MPQRSALTKELKAAISAAELLLTNPLSANAKQYLNYTIEMTPTRDTVAMLQHLARLVEAEQVALLRPLIRTLGVNRCAATLHRVRQKHNIHPQQLDNYERYLREAAQGKSLFELTLLDHCQLI